MFVQVIKGKTSDPDAVRRRFDEWKASLGSGAAGWRGTTAGVTDDGTFIAVVEFDSAEAARANSDRPEQGRWWSETEPLLADVQFVDSDDVMTLLGGPDPDATFVQVIEERVSDVERARKFWEVAEREIPRQRPDVRGGIAAFHGDHVTQVVYFSDEGSAREGESRQSDEEQQSQMAEMADVFSDPTYLDLRDPWHQRP